MRSRPVFLLLLALPLLLHLPGQTVDPAQPFETVKPWTRWWWPGNAVDRTSITQQLEQFAAAGLGGVEITPIYGARGAEERAIEYLSPRWMEMLTFTAREAQRLGLGVDMATGTGWPFGGPWVKPEDAAAQLVLLDGKLSGSPTGMKVKRAAPGAEGLVIDPYSTTALNRYLAPFTQAFANFPAGLVRSQFHDSFEYYNASWSPELAPAFQKLHGYDLQDHAAELLGQKPLEPDSLARLKSDYRATLAKLHLEYLQTWIRWSHEHGFLVRNQSHGAPANLLDLYGAVDIPETETFGSTPFPIPGLRHEWSSRRDLPDSLVLRMASSAAHVMGHPLASSETCTWLREHWQVALSSVKPEIDRLFTTGINHVFFHGTVFSPRDAAWPGWLFYASTQFSPHNTWWADFAALNTYIARVQTVLQAGRPDNDVLLYWPFADVIDDPDGLMKQYGVHDRKWLEDSPFERVANQLLKAGFSFDYISDAQLQDSRVEAGAIVTPGGGHYRAVVIPATRRMPVETLSKLLVLQQGGGAVVYESVPEDVPGFGNLSERRAQFREIIHGLGMSGSAVGNIIETLTQRGAVREPLAETGLSYIRRAQPAGYDYFFANLTGQPFKGWLELGTVAQAATLTDPLTGQAGIAALRPAAKSQIYLQLAPGESVLCHTLTAAPSDPEAVKWINTTPAGPAMPPTGEWQITFVTGGPDLPPPLKTTELKSWTEIGGESAQRFGGTARYRLEFDRPAAPAAADDWLLDLGDVRESARVRLNGAELATAWSLPFRLRVGAHLQPGRNVLELDVTNLAANRIRDLDRRKVHWKIMHDINLVNLEYKPFDASAWPLAPSGLLGPVTLTPLRILPLP